MANPEIVAENHAIYVSLDNVHMIWSHALGRSSTMLRPIPLARGDIDTSSDEEWM